ncbi:hypothetical protein CWM98_34610, partial [Klebsiella variicola]
ILPVLSLRLPLLICGFASMVIILNHTIFKVNIKSLKHRYRSVFHNSDHKYSKFHYEKMKE